MQMEELKSKDSSGKVENGAAALLHGTLLLQARSMAWRSFMQLAVKSLAKASTSACPIGPNRPMPRIL